MSGPHAIETGNRSLSFAFRRPADEAELRRLDHMAGLFAVNPRRSLIEFAWVMGQAVGLLLLVMPVLYVAVLILEAATGMHVNSPTLWPNLIIAWFAVAFCIGLGRVLARSRCERHIRAALSTDIAAGEVVEEAWRFVGCIAFQEAETFPFLFAMQADNGAVIMLEEASLSGCDTGHGNAARSVAPADAVLVRGAASGALLSENYSGPCLPIQALYRLTVPDECRPPHGALLDARWDEMPALFSQKGERLS